MYVKDDIVYPVAMSHKQLELLQLFAKGIFGDEPVKVISTYPQGKVKNLVE